MMPRFVIEMQDNNPLVFYSIAASVRVDRSGFSGTCNQEVAWGIPEDLGQRNA